jgi:nucleotide-binding universal stress UspA family protein
MIAFTHILCPIDFSDTSARALAWAAALARWYEARVTVLHVAPAFEGPVGAHRSAEEGQPPLPGSREAVEARIRAAVEHADPDGLNVRVVAQEGRPSDLIVNGVVAMKADLVVMGTRGVDGVQRLVLGSVTEKVVRTAACPVLTVPPAAAATTAADVRFTRILCPIDESPSSLKALEYALDLGRQAGGRVTVLSVVEHLDPNEPCEHVDPEVLRRRQKAIDQAHQRLLARVAAEPQTWCEVEPVVAVNRADQEILRRAAAGEAQLIVMGAQGHRGLDLVLFGSTTQHVLRAAACPVLTVRA